jgi:hypothetical protein
LGHCVGRLGVLACLSFPVTAAAQLPPLGAPRGAVRFEVDGGLETWDTRYLDGTKEGLGADLTSPTLGSDRIPLLADADARIGRVTGIAGYRINLGALATDAIADRGIANFGLSLGLTKSITIFGRLPLVRVRVQRTTRLNPTSADAGLNPGEVAQSDFLTQFDNAIATLNARLAAGDYDADPNLRALAQATLTDATALRGDLDGLLADPETASPVVPTTSSAAGTAINSRLDALQSTLTNNLGVPGFTADPALPSEPLTEADLETILTDPSGPFRFRSGESTVSFRGDGETGITLTLVDRWDRGTRGGGLRAAVEGLVRYPTGVRARTDRLLALGTGDGQTDVEGHAVVDVGSARLGVRLEAGYNRQFATNIVARVAPPSQPFVGVDRLANVRWDPGDVVTLAARPFFRLSRALALQGTVLHWSHGTDETSYVSDQDVIPGVDAAVLAEDSKTSATTLGIGMSYADLGRVTAGGRGLPVDAGWSYDRVVRASGGRVPNSHRIRAWFRIAVGLF